jgi:hypothetical protein
MKIKKEIEKEADKISRRWRLLLWLVLRTVTETVEEDGGECLETSEHSQLRQQYEAI